MSVIFIVTAEPSEGVTTTVAEYFPFGRSATFTVNVVDEDMLGSLLPLAGETVNQVADGVPTDHVKVPPPVLVMVMG
mgnify:CR=1 FL=1